MVADALDHLENLSRAADPLSGGDDTGAPFWVSRNKETSFRGTSDELIHLPNLVLQKTLTTRFADLEAKDPGKGETPAMYCYRVLQQVAPPLQRYKLLNTYGQVLDASGLPEPDWLKDDRRAHGSF